jgi:pyruvate/2-oxoglutarate dehydrogenase complex dihydrolipoamide acyltransferase (E2) component
VIYQISIPAVAEDVDEIRVLEWHGGPGTTFQPGELVVEFETHKAVVEVRAGRAGVLREILVEAGAWASVGTPIARFTDGPDEPLPAGAEDIPELVVEFQMD